MNEPKTTSVFKGIGVSPGIVSGRAFVLNHQDMAAPSYHLVKASQVAEEIRRFRKALKSAEQELAGIREKMASREGIESRFIDVHTLILKDRSYRRDTVNFIREKRINAEWALRLTLLKYRDVFSRMEDEYLRERIADVENVTQRVLRNLSAVKPDSISEIRGECIVISRDLSPADTVQMSPDTVLGFATDMGGKTSHTAIVARSMEIPAVVGLQEITANVQNEDTVIIDGTAGVVIVNPDPEVLKRYADKKKHYWAMSERYLRDAHFRAVTRDGHFVHIGANIEFIEEIPSVLAHGADGVGLYRTEFLYINRDRLPTEEEHFENYRRLVENPGVQWSTIRTFDLGGDKFISDPRLAEEMNPAMGLRAIRFCLQEVDLFKSQLRAILRAGAIGNTRILFPMISGVKEIREAKRILEEVREDLRREGIPFGPKLEIGVMIEVPSAVMMADALAREVDFFSIGTNDLIQYSLAIDRVNDRVTYLYEPLHPAILRLIQRVVRAGHEAGIRIAMCGEMAGDPMCTMVLIGLGLDELSMTPLAIPKVKHIIRNVSREECREMVDEAMKRVTGEEIEEFVWGRLKDRFPDEFHGSGL
ncbi:MAG TPA: phosphoenolpyruvate--protein phosphotransferase [Syntrophales bacterium]|nr:phosphoenolpyruvate--protein phosphotransferase [Syntrophales bacterium]HQB30462.1 phosphoenolpyruvate--protein phosphotransferase [Syntrophales bacterium]HQN76905.1 phosphoenolpyruvate--protein phosphotransferase [Syntrophales bacterium]HQQ26912.1 phosphoenolpyruvate--protein phosphotransferase [Syntrophales bacterium]